MSDQALLQEYVATGCQTAFRQLVERHLALVYSAARRRLGDPHLAQDVAQQVFALLAQKARKLDRSVILAGWLYRTACQIASQTRRGETRRHYREQLTAGTMNSTESEPAWQELEPLLDDAMAGLSPTDRDAVVLRFFQNKSLREVGAALGVSDDAAQKRLSRAIEKLRVFFARRGKTVGATALTAAISAGAVQAVPSGLAASVAGAVLSGAVAVTATTTTLKLMSWTTLKPILATAAAVGAATVITVERLQVNEQRRANQTLAAQLKAAEQAQAEAQEQARQATLAVERDPRNAEIARLRGELARLRQAQAQMASENGRLRAAVKPRAKATEPQPPAEPDEAADPTLDASRRLCIAKLNYAKLWGLALILHAENDNGGRLPDSLEQAAKYLQPDRLDPVSLSEEFKALKPEQFELMYRGSWKELKDPAKTIILREKEPFETTGRAGLARTYLFADGHSEVHYAADSNFEPWEQERLVAPPQP